MTESAGIGYTISAIYGSKNQFNTMQGDFYEQEYEFSRPYLLLFF